DFVGKRALLDRSGSAPKKRLVGLEMLKRSVPRVGYDVADGPRGQSPCAASRDRIVGRVTSGTMSPTLGKGIALAYVESGSAVAGRELGVVIRGRAVPCAVVETPFYKRGRQQ
ncbi:MAG: glycine cleavage T C-terminal barrel domain-containing protein, partial [Planctomycetota bacterium]